jgi:hypothetical protein
MLIKSQEISFNHLLKRDIELLIHITFAIPLD